MAIGDDWDDDFYDRPFSGRSVFSGSYYNSGYDHHPPRIVKQSHEGPGRKRTRRYKRCVSSISMYDSAKVEAVRQGKKIDIPRFFEWLRGKYPERSFGGTSMPDELEVDQWKSLFESRPELLITN